MDGRSNASGQNLMRPNYGLVSLIPHCTQVPLRQIPMQLHELVLLASDVLHDLVQFSQEDDRIGDRCITAALTAAWGVTLDLDGLCSFRYHPPQRASRLGLITTTPGADL